MRTISFEDEVMAAEEGAARGQADERNEYEELAAEAAEAAAAYWKNREENGPKTMLANRFAASYNGTAASMAALLGAFSAEAVAMADDGRLSTPWSDAATELADFAEWFYDEFGDDAAAEETMEAVFNGEPPALAFGVTFLETMTAIDEATQFDSEPEDAFSRDADEITSSLADDAEDAEDGRTVVVAFLAPKGSRDGGPELGVPALTGGSTAIELVLWQAWMKSGFSYMRDEPGSRILIMTAEGQKMQVAEYESEDGRVAPLPLEEVIGDFQEYLENEGGVSIEGDLAEMITEAAKTGDLRFGKAGSGGGDGAGGADGEGK